VRALPKKAFVRAAWSVVGRKVNKQAKLEETERERYVYVTGQVASGRRAGASAPTSVVASAIPPMLGAWPV
jgi:hypothetical protein